MEQVFDLAPFEQAGFVKQYSDEEWAQMQQQLAPTPGTGLRVDYVLVRGDVTLTVEQNNRDEYVQGALVTLRYPEVVRVDGPGGVVACAASDTELILAMADQVMELPARRPQDIFRSNRPHSGPRNAPPTPMPRNADDV